MLLALLGPIIGSGSGNQHWMCCKRAWFAANGVGFMEGCAHKMLIYDFVNLREATEMFGVWGMMGLHSTTFKLAYMICGVSIYFVIV